MVKAQRQKTIRRALFLASVVIGVAAGLVLWRFDPASHSWYPKCLLHSWTGLHCPGCGTTRAVHSLVQGRLWDAFRFNPLLIAGGPIMALLIIRQRKRERKSGIAAPRLSWALVAVVCLYFVARNVPSPTRSWFAPPQQAPPQQARPKTMTNNY